MHKLIALALFACHGAASAQTPAINPMPDGSRDMYIGLGVQSMPRYEGADSRKTRALPLLQVQWSNGIFVSGMTAGVHLSSRPGVEFGPLLAVQPSRSQDGTGHGAAGIGYGTAIVPFAPQRDADGQDDNRLAGMGDIHTRVLGGGFFNYYLSPEWRLTSSVLWGAGNERDGGIAELGVQRLAAIFAPHHSLSVSAGLTVANHSYNQAFFGVSSEQSVKSGNAFYTPAGGLKDGKLAARWNWALSPGWLATSNVQAVRLLGSAKNSPLVERPLNVTVSAAIAYRF